MKFVRSKPYREEFVASQVKRGIPFQIRALLKQHNLSQEELAERASLTQGVVSRAANPNYGNLTLNTLIRIAAGFDVAFVGKFVPFSELGDWFTDLSEDNVLVPSFVEENATMQKREKARLKAAENGKILDINGLTSGGNEAAGSPEVSNPPMSKQGVNPSLGHPEPSGDIRRKNAERSLTNYNGSQADTRRPAHVG